MSVLFLLWCHRTKVLGFTQVTLGVLSTADGIFTPFGLKCIILASGIATAWVGFFNSRQANKAE